MTETVELELMDADDLAVTYASECAGEHVFNTEEAFSLFGVCELDDLPKKIELELTW